MERADKAGVSIIVQNSLNPESTRKSIELAERFSSVRLALGIYPVDALKLSDEQIDREIEFITQHKDSIIAVGEVGLDYHWVKDREQQKRQCEIFKKFIGLAEELKKPLIIHSRESEKDAFEMLLSSDAKAVFHCFNGSLELAKKAQDKGYYLSIPASITFIKHFQDIAAEIGLSQLLCETDAPYMSPFRGKRNEPAFVVESYKKIAAIKKMALGDVAAEIRNNYKRLFGKNGQDD